MYVLWFSSTVKTASAQGLNLTKLGFISQMTLEATKNSIHISLRRLLQLTNCFWVWGFWSSRMLHCIRWKVSNSSKYYIPTKHQEPCTQQCSGTSQKTRTVKYTIVKTSKIHLEVSLLQELAIDSKWQPHIIFCSDNVSDLIWILNIQNYNFADILYGCEHWFLQLR